LDDASHETIKLLLVDDHAMFREGLARSISREPHLKVVGQFASSTEALGSLNQSGANVVLLDVDLGAEKALDFVVAAKRTGFAGQILIVTAGASNSSGCIRHFAQAPFDGDVVPDDPASRKRRSVSGEELSGFSISICGPLPSANRSKAHRARQDGASIHIAGPHEQRDCRSARSIGGRRQGIVAPGVQQVGSPNPLPGCQSCLRTVPRSTVTMRSCIRSLTVAAQCRPGITSPTPLRAPGFCSCRSRQRPALRPQVSHR